MAARQFAKRLKRVDKYDIAKDLGARAYRTHSLTK